MRIEYVDPFANSAYEIINEIVGTGIVRKEPFLREKSQSIHGVAIIIGLTGDISGRLIIDMSPVTAVNVASAICSEKIAELDEFSASALCELANTIAGRAVTTLSDMGYQIYITPPSMMTGEKMNVNNFNNIESLIVPIEIPEGIIEINIAIVEEL